MYSARVLFSLLLVGNLFLLAQAQVRSRLKFSELMGDKRGTAPIPNDLLLPTSSWNPRLHDLKGRFTFPQTLGNHSGTILFGAKPIYNGGGQYDGPEMYLPAFDVEFFQVGDAVVPKIRHWQAHPSHPYWEYIVMPGRSWSEREDQGYTRVLLPFALTEIGENCVYNGLMSFLFKSDGSISRAWYQITQETCAYLKLNLWGWASPTYVPSSASTSILEANYATEVSNRVQLKPIQQLVDKVEYETGKKIDVKKLRQVRNVSPPGLTTFGVVLSDGNMYTDGVDTRSGLHPFPESVVFPQYSLMKSHFVSFLAARIEKKYGATLPTTPSSSVTTSSIYELVISDWIPEAYAWTDVKFKHVIDMSTGRFNSLVYGADEASNDVINQFFLDRTHAGKIRHATQYYPRKADPGTVFGYHSSDFYLAGRVLELVVQKVAGVSLLSFAKTELFDKIKLSALWVNQKVTYDTVKQPHSAYDGFGTYDDMAKIIRFLVFGKGASTDAVQLLDETSVKKMLYLDPSDRGSVRDSAAEWYYNDGFWANKAITPGVCPDAHVPYMSGFGGIRAYLGVGRWGYWYSSDDNEFAGGPPTTELASTIGCPILTQ